MNEELIHRLAKNCLASLNEEQIDSTIYKEVLENVKDAIYNVYDRGRIDGWKEARGRKEP